MYKHKLNSLLLMNTNQFYLDNIYKQFLSNSHFLNNSWLSFLKDFSNKKEQELILKSKSKKHSSNCLLILELINILRNHGHYLSNLDPLQLTKKREVLALSQLLNNDHLSNIQEKFSLNLVHHSFFKMTFQEIFSVFSNIYCKNIGYEYMYILNDIEKKWIQSNVELKYINKIKLKDSEKIQVLNHLINSEVFEQYISSKFIGMKRFSLEGAESLIPMLHEITNYTKNYNLHKIIIGMSHRGRLNVLVNFLEKPISMIFNEFNDNNANVTRSGDVKYHMGYDFYKTINNKKIHIDLKFNPSHLEIINPVVIGSARSYIDSSNNLNEENVLPIVIHGDAAISGQGVVQESLNMSQTAGYCVGGSIHIIINNQIGFTTSNIEDLRTSWYCTDIAKMIDVPVFHVNADDPESVIFIIRLALDYRFKFKKDVFIDLVCYRRHGHNEIDDPSITQPIMYAKIASHPTIVQSYSAKLMLNNVIEKNYLNLYFKKQKKKLSDQLSSNINKPFIISKLFLNNNDINTIKKNNCNYITTKSLLSELAVNINTIPKYINVHDRVLKIYNDRLKMAHGIKNFDWGAAELLAYASLLNIGISCRLSGEDVCRGTFFQRNVVVYDQINNSTYNPLQHIHSKQGNFYIWNSVLSEEATLAFEYGYSLNQKNKLNVWEAQFGDFANGAQIVIDQFLCSGEQKWDKKCNLVMLLPHGYEGQGPEHSSARLERYLQLSAENNIIVSIPTTSAQIYHLLRNHVLFNIQKPLIIFSPKSLLRNKLASSSLSELSDKNFQKVIDEIDDINLKEIKRIIFCSGKIYYDLLNQRRINKQNDIIIIRIEQLYPFPKKEISVILNKYITVSDFLWCQEESFNQGAWFYSQYNLTQLLPKKSKLSYVGRLESASPATSYMNIHKQQQKNLVHNALTIK